MGADPLNEGGQFWTPILPAKGSILHAGSQDETENSYLIVSAM
jgi:hypothetical protein